MREKRTWVRPLSLFVAATLGLVLVAERGRPLLPSSRRALRWMGLCHILDLSIVHVYVYGRWTKQYMWALRRLLPRLDYRGGRHLANVYHAKVLTPEHVRSVVLLDRDIDLRNLEQVIPYSQARDLVLSAPPELVLYECACRLSRPTHCEPTQVCIAIGQPFVDFVLDHHPREARRVTPEEALKVLEEEHERGHVHTAWFRTAARGRFYAVCNCCPCCCVGLEGMAEHGIPLMASSGFVAGIDAGRCTGCGGCGEACPFGAVEITGGAAVVDRSRCLGCSVCVDHCPQGAIILERDPAKGDPLDVRVLIDGVAG